jgi:UDP-N-acetylglucosamine--N-acetylmuramyl-(pentapeptide) pyrophosphoryl-undecaprenol N-acetylglucosamine transferase
LAEGLLSENQAFSTWLESEPEISQKLIKTTVFPVAKWLNGIDLAVAAAGYNTFHELLYFGIPTVFIPKPRGYDDQSARATQATNKNACLVCEENEDFPVNFNMAFEKLLVKETRENLKQHAMDFVPENHAKQAAQAILESWKNSFVV